MTSSGFSRCDPNRLYPLEIDTAHKSMKIFGIFGLPEGAIEEFECLDFMNMVVGSTDNGIAWIEFHFSEYDPISTILTFPDLLVCILYQHFHQ